MIPNMGYFSNNISHRNDLFHWYPQDSDGINAAWNNAIAEEFTKYYPSVAYYDYAYRMTIKSQLEKGRCW